MSNQMLFTLEGSLLGRTGRQATPEQKQLLQLVNVVSKQHPRSSHCLWLMPGWPQSSLPLGLSNLHRGSLVLSVCRRVQLLTLTLTMWLGFDPQLRLTPGKRSVVNTKFNKFSVNQMSCHELADDKNSSKYFCGSNYAPETDQSNLRVVSQLDW